MSRNRRRNKELTAWPNAQTRLIIVIEDRPYLFGLNWIDTTHFSVRTPHMKPKSKSMIDCYWSPRWVLSAKMWGMISTVENRLFELPFKVRRVAAWELGHKLRLLFFLLFFLFLFYHRNRLLPRTLYILSGWQGIIHQTFNLLFLKNKILSND